MSTTRIHNELHFECDTCGETFEIGDSDFNTTWNAAKREGWTARKIGNIWNHACNECNEEEE
jgi:Fe2+ or Zn2+ uptake regulation protein